MTVRLVNLPGAVDNLSVEARRPAGRRDLNWQQPLTKQGCFMNKKVLGLVAIISLLDGQAIFAGSMGDATSVYSWHGLYGGLNGGYAWSNGKTSVLPLPTPATIPEGYGNVLPTSLPVSMSGGVIGGQVGYNWHSNNFPNWVVGLETDMNWIGLNGSARGNEVGDAVLGNATFYNVLSTKQKTNWFGTLRPRVGFLANGTFLIYATGGLAYGNMAEQANTNYFVNNYGDEQYPATKDVTKAGWAAGGGLEYALKQHVSIKLEYLYYDLGSTSSIANPSIPNPPFQVKYTWQNAPQVVRLGVNYLM